MSKYRSSSLKKEDLLAVMCLEAPLSTYHLTPETMLVERHDSMEKVVSNLDASSSAPTEAFSLLANYFCCWLPFPLFSGHLEA